MLNGAFVKVFRSWVAISWILAGSAAAEVPGDSNFQGLLTDASGSALAGPVDIGIGFFDQLVDGTALYSEEHPAVALTDGVFDILLGTGSSVVGSYDAALFAEANRWLEVTIDGETLAPRQPVNSVPYAFQVSEASVLASRVADLEALVQALTGEVCGNGALEGDEQCDDGNNSNGDGCESDCTETPVENCQEAPSDPTFNNPLDIPLDSTASVLEFVSFAGGDTQDKSRFDVIGMNPNPSLPGGRARLVLSANCFGQGTNQVEFFVNGQTFSCGQTIYDQEVTNDSNSGTVTITAVGGVCTYVQWVLTGTATRTN